MNEKNTGMVSDSEMEKLVTIYKQLQEPNKSIIVMGANLLLTSQNAEMHQLQKNSDKAG